MSRQVDSTALKPANRNLLATLLKMFGQAERREPSARTSLRRAEGGAEQPLEVAGVLHGAV
jgi:hypothetical protein